MSVYRWSQTIPMVGKKNTSGHHYKSLQYCDDLVDLVLNLGLSRVLVFINRHSPTMNLVEEKQRGLIPPGFQSWPLQHMVHLTDSTSVVPPTADPAGCCPLYLLHLLHLSLTIWAPNRCCILQFRAYPSFECNLLSTYS